MNLQWRDGEKKRHWLFYLTNYSHIILQILAANWPLFTLFAGLGGNHQLNIVKPIQMTVKKKLQYYLYLYYVYAVA